MGRRPALVALALVIAGVLAAPAAAADPQLELAQRYAPVIRLVEQDEPCGHGEPFQPIDVDLVLDNPEVALRGTWTSDNIVKVGPTARDLAGPLIGYQLDFPGETLDPGCDYDTWSRSLTAGSKPATYARVVTEPGRPGKLALQYWLFYVYNDWNDKHEGDWEMIQLDFDAADAAEALSRQPTEVGFSQHEGAESAQWRDDKLTRIGSHPVVYPANGSHANYFDSDLHLGRSAAQGVGCDETEGPSRELRPEVKLVPTAKDAYLQRYPWLAYEGRWGEDHPGFYGGPTGPITKTQWNEPITWADEEWRDSSYTVPAGRELGTSATDFFCGAVASGSALLTKLVENPTGVLIALSVFVALILWLGSRTSWDQTNPFRASRRRPWGSLVTTGLRLYRRQPALFLGIGLLFIPLGLLIAGLQYLIFRIGGLAPLVDSAGESNAVVVGLAFGLGLFFTILGLNVVQAASAIAIAELDKGTPINARAAYRLALERLPALLRALVGAGIVVTLLVLTGAGIPIALWLIVRWSFLPQVVMLEEEVAHPLRRSAALVRGHWWRVATITLFVTGTGLFLGPLIGTLLLLLTPASFDVINLVAALVYTVALPFAAIVTAYLYYDVRVRQELRGVEYREDGPLPAEIPA